MTAPIPQPAAGPQPPRWVTDPDVIASIRAGLVPLPDLNDPTEQPSKEEQ